MEWILPILAAASAVTFSFSDPNSFASCHTHNLHSSLYIVYHGTPSRNSEPHGAFSSTNKRFSLTGPYCEWTECKDLTNVELDVCKDLSGKRYVRRTGVNGCQDEAERVECCLPLPPGSVQWTRGCYTVNYSHSTACITELGPEFRDTGKAQPCTETLKGSNFQCER